MLARIALSADREKKKQGLGLGRVGNVARFYFVCFTGKNHICQVSGFVVANLSVMFNYHTQTRKNYFSIQTERYVVVLEIASTSCTLHTNKPLHHIVSIIQCTKVYTVSSSRTRAVSQF